MDYPDPSDKKARLEEFRQKIKTMPIEELIALTAIMKRRTDDLTEELRVLADQVMSRRQSERRKRSS